MIADRFLTAASLSPAGRVWVVAGLGLVLTVWLTLGTSIGADRVAFGLAFGIAAIVSLRWRIGVYLVLFYVTIEGAITNALHPETYPLFLKDVLVAAAYTGFVASLLFGRGERLPPRSVVIPFAALVAVSVVGAFNPLGDPVVALIGFRVLLFYIPLYALGYALVHDLDGLARPLSFVIFGSVPIALFGVIQYVVGPEAIAGLAPGFARSIWIIGPEATDAFIYRPASTFAFVGHFGAYLFFVALISFAALHREHGLPHRAAVVGILTTALTAVVLQSQRTVWVLLPLGILATYVLTRSWRPALLVLPAVLFAVAASLGLGQSVLENRVPILASTGPYAAWLEPQLIRFVSGFTMPEALTGHGTGTALGAIRYVTGGDVPEAFESGWFAAFYMFGVAGLAIYAWLYAAVIHRAWRGCIAAAPDRRWLPVAVVAYLGLTAAIAGAISYPPTNIYFWLFGGAVGALARPRDVASEDPTRSSRRREIG